MNELIRPALKASRWDIPRGGTHYLCRITSGHGWWDLDDELESLPGRRPVIARSNHPWHAIPVDQLQALEAIAESNPGRVIIHHVA